MNGRSIAHGRRYHAVEFGNIHIPIRYNRERNFDTSISLDAVDPAKMGMKTVVRRKGQK